MTRRLGRIMWNERSPAPLLLHDSSPDRLLTEPEGDFGDITAGENGAGGSISIDWLPLNLLSLSLGDIGVCVARSGARLKKMSS